MKKIEKKLFMTATEKIFRGKGNNVISMNDEKIYGNFIELF